MTYQLKNDEVNFKRDDWCNLGLGVSSTRINDLLRKFWRNSRRVVGPAYFPNTFIRYWAKKNKDLIELDPAIQAGNRRRDDEKERNLSRALVPLN